MNVKPAAYGKFVASHANFQSAERPCPNLKKLVERKRTDINIHKKVDSERVRSIAAGGELNVASDNNVFKVGPMLRTLK